MTRANSGVSSQSQNEWSYNKACTNKLCMDKVIIRLAPVNYVFRSQVHFQLLIHFCVTGLKPGSWCLNSWGCQCTHCSLHLLKKCLSLNQGLLNEMTSDTWSVLCYCYVKFNSHKTLFRIWVQVVLWMKGLFFLWFSFSLIFLLLSRYFNCIYNF